MIEILRSGLARICCMKKVMKIINQPMIINISDLPIFENIPISRDEDYNTLGPDEQMQLYDVGPKEHIKPAKI